MANRPGDPRGTYRWKQIRAAILADDPPCEYCGVPATCVDDRIPLARGGDPWDAANLTPSCQPCNLARCNDHRPAGPTGAGVPVTRGVWATD